MPGFANTVVLVCGVVLISAHVLMLLRAAWKRLRSCSKDDIFEVAQHLCIWRKPITGTDLVGELASKKMDDRMVSAVKAFMFPASSALCCLLFSVQWSILAGRERWMTTSQDVILLTSLFLTITCYRLPVLVEGFKVHVVYAMVMLHLCLVISFGSIQSSSHVATTAQCFCFRVLASVSYLKTKNLLFWNVLYCFASCRAYWQNSEIKQQEEALFTPLVFSISEVAMLLCLVWLAHALRLSRYAEIIAELSASSSHDECKASKSLLGLVCDVVVELDKNLVVVEHTPGFAALLMLSSSKSTKGLRLQSFFADPYDEQRFEHHMLAAGVDSQHLAGTFNVDMQDSIGSTANFELFHVQFNAIDGSACPASGTDVSPHRAPDNSHPTTPTRPRGTKAVRQIAERGSFATKDHAAVEPRRMTKSRQLTFPHLRKTDWLVHDSSLITAMAQWNLEVPRSFCCSMHARTMELKAASKRFTKLDCAAFPTLIPGTLQCRQCGFFEDGEIDEAAHLKCSVCSSMSWQDTSPTTEHQQDSPVNSCSL